MSGKKDGDGAVATRGLSKPVRVEKLRVLNSVAQSLDGLNAYSARERAWLKWFFSLSEGDKKIVEICGEQDILVIPTNFDQMRKLVREHDAEDSGSHEKNLLGTGRFI